MLERKDLPMQVQGAATSAANAAEKAAENIRRYVEENRSMPAGTPIVKNTNSPFAADDSVLDSIDGAIKALQELSRELRQAT